MFPPPPFILLSKPSTAADESLHELSAGKPRKLSVRVYHSTSMAKLHWPSPWAHATGLLFLFCLY